MFHKTRQEVRLFFFETRRKMRHNEALHALERVAAEIIRNHPEYHTILDTPQKYEDYDFSPDRGIMNPFLHLSLHLTIEEQVQINQPQGIRSYVEQEQIKGKETHATQHVILHILAEEIWESLHHNKPFHHVRYAQRIKSLLNH